VTARRQHTAITKMKVKVVQNFSVAAAKAGVFANLVNKICKIMRIFQQLDHLKN
jgi:hypothetical protein